MTKIYIVTSPNGFHHAATFDIHEAITILKEHTSGLKDPMGWTIKPVPFVAGKNNRMEFHVRDDKSARLKIEFSEFQKVETT